MGTVVKMCSKAGPGWVCVNVTRLVDAVKMYTASVAANDDRQHCELDVGLFITAIIVTKRFSVEKHKCKPHKVMLHKKNTVDIKHEAETGY